MLVTQAYMRGQYDDVVFIKEELNQDWSFAAPTSRLAPLLKFFCMSIFFLFSLPNTSRIDPNPNGYCCVVLYKQHREVCDQSKSQGLFVLIQLHDSYHLHPRVLCSPVTSRGTVSCSSLMPTTTSQRYRPESLDRRPLNARLAL